VREEWRVTDMLMNPMVIMLVVAFFLLLVTPKLASNDPELQKVTAPMPISVVVNREI